MKTKKRFLSILLSLALVLGLLPGMSLTALAATRQKCPNGDGHYLDFEDTMDGQVFCDNCADYVTPVTVSVAPFDVTLTGGANATADPSDKTSQSGLTGAMTTVTYTANSGCQFPATSGYYTTINGITVTKTSDTVVTVSGTPTADMNITVPDAVVAWSENQEITASSTLYGVIVTADIKLTIPEGKTLTVNGGINASGKTLTVEGAGTLIVNGANGANSSNANGGNGDSGFKGTLIVNGATVNVTGGNGGNGGVEEWNGCSGGNGGAGVDGSITVQGGSATLNGGSGGSGGQHYADPGADGRPGRAVSGTITGKAEESDNGSNFTAITGTTSSKRYVKAEAAVPAHTHAFTYSVGTGDAANTITANCGGTGTCDITEGLTLTISAPTGELTADGTTTFPATLNEDYNTTAFPGTYSITYTKDGAAFTGTPTEAGAYVASVTVGEGDDAVTASVSYTVNAAAATTAYGDLLNTTTVVHFDGKDWYLIEDNSTAANAGTVTLLSKECVAASKYNSSGSFVEYSSNPTVKTAVDNYYNNSISTDAKTAVSGGMFLLTKDQASVMTNDARKCSNFSGTNYRWWLCSPGLDYKAACVNGYDGDVYGNGISAEYTLGVRPALKLDLSKVTFDSTSNTFSVGASAHTHSFTYSVGTGDNANTITATCGNTGCDITEGLTLTISAPTGDLTADGSKTFPATLSTGYNTTAFPGTYNISYTKDGSSFSGTPTEAGDYTASVTVGEGDDAVTASVSYTVNAAAATTAYGDLLNTTTVVHFDGKDWYLIEDNSTAANAGTVTLLAKECVTASQYNSSGSFVEYSSNPTVKTAVDNYYNNSISANAKTAVSDGGMFLLTTAQANAITSADVRKCTRYSGTDYNGWCSAIRVAMMWTVRRSSSALAATLAAMAATCRTRSASAPL